MYHRLGPPGATALLAGLNMLMVSEPARLSYQTLPMLILSRSPCYSRAEFRFLCLSSSTATAPVSVRALDSHIRELEVDHINLDL